MNLKVEAKGLSRATAVLMSNKKGPINSDYC